ncbi:MAG: IS21 family transposase [Acidobacteriota bacterium]|nr:MAG: IS21 family transposase [Acidobacteriota bacterium]
MTISPEQRAEIRRLYYAEHWKVGTIAVALGVHRDSVRRAIESERFGTRAARPRPSQLDPFVPFIRETLKRYPKLRATRLHQMLRERGYGGSVVQLRRVVARLRPSSRGEAYLRLRALPGEQAQVDWGSFGSIQVGRIKRPLSCFVMVLSWSRALHAVFTLDQRLESFLRGHVEAFRFFQGVPRVALYDNLKSAVLERRGDAIRFHPRLLELCAHYHFEARPVAPGRGNEKGRVERQIQYLRTSFFAARSFRDVDDLNAQFRTWRDEVAHTRLVPGERFSVQEALEQERGRLLALPGHPFETDFVDVTRSGKTPYVRFDRNLYSIPHELARKPLTLVAGPDAVRILDGKCEVARHRRSYSGEECIEDPAHVEALVQHKRNARETRVRDRLKICVPETETLFERLASRGEPLGLHTTRLLRLLDDYGADELREATRMALERKAFSSGSIAHLLEQRRRSRGLKPPVQLQLPDDPRVRDLRVIPHRLEDYDALGNRDEDS